MTTPIELSVDVGSRLNKRLKLDEIVILQVSARTVDYVENPTFCYSLKLEPVQWNLAGSLVFAVYGVKVSLQHQDDDSARRTLGKLSVNIRVDYEAVEPLDEDEEAIPHFLGIVGWMNVWPYLRAEVQQLSTKLGFPPLVLPLMLSGHTKKVPVIRMGPASDEAED